MIRIIPGSVSLMLLLISLSLATGCASVSKGFIGDTHANIVPFAEQTIASIGVERIDLRSDEMIYLRQRIDTNAEVLRFLREQLGRVDEFRDEIVYYSVGLLRISQMPVSEEEMVSALVEHISSPTRARFIQQANIDPALRQEVFDAMSSQTHLFTALQDAQTLIDASGEYFESVVREIEEQAIPAARQYLDDRIPIAYGRAIDYTTIMEARRDELLHGMTLLRQIRKGDSESWTELKDASIVFEESPLTAEVPTEHQLSMIDNYILEAMENENSVNSYLQVDIDAYLASHRELDAAMSEILSGVNLARLQVVAWSRAHKAMADGIRDPGTFLLIAGDAARAVRGR